MPHVEGSPEQMKALIKADIDGPIHMLNMLRFKADGGAKSTANTPNTPPYVEKTGGKVVYRSVGRVTVVGGEDWDEVFIVEYPSRKAFLDMILSEECQKDMHLRHDALDDSRLICLQTQEPGQH